MTRLQLDNAARHTLRTARAAQAVLHGPDGEAQAEVVLAELLLDFGEMTGSPGLLQPDAPTLADKKELARLVAEAALFVRAHNWIESDLKVILHKVQGAEDQPHDGERLVEEFLDGLGTLQLVASDDGADWGFRILKDASADDEKRAVVVKAARYLLHPSFLMIFGDITEILGDAQYATNVKRFTECMAGIEALTTECLPPPDELVVPDELVAVLLSGPGPESLAGPGSCAEEPCVPPAEDLDSELYGPGGPWPRDDGGDPPEDLDGPMDLGGPGARNRAARRPAWPYRGL